MPQLETALYEYLTDDPGVSALIGTRLFPNLVPEGTVLPAISYRRISTQRTYTYSSFDEEAWTRARVQFDCWATTALASMQVGEALLAALSGFFGDMAGQLIGSSDNVTESDIYEQPTKLHRRSLDFFISFQDDLTS